MRIADYTKPIPAAEGKEFVYFSGWPIKEHKMEKEDGELISQIRLRGLKPSQVFKADEIRDDPGFEDMIKAEVDYKIWLRQQELEDEDNKDLQRQIKEEKLKDENELIPGSDYEINDEGEKEEKQEKGKEKKKNLDDNELIPDVDPKSSSSDSGSDNDLIPE